jgi:hypothetical protein
MSNRLATSDGQRQVAQRLFWEAFFGLRNDPLMQPCMNVLEKLVDLYTQASGHVEDWEDEPTLEWDVLAVEAEVSYLDPDGSKGVFVNAVNAWLESCNLKADWVRDDLLDFLDEWARDHFEFGVLPWASFSLGGYTPPKEFFDAPPILPKLTRFDPEVESVEKYAQWCADRTFEVARAYAESVFSAHEAIGLTPLKSKRIHYGSPADWFVRYQVLGEDFRQITESLTREGKNGILRAPDETTVPKAVPLFADEIGLDLRK